MIKGCIYIRPLFTPMLLTLMLLAALPTNAQMRRIALHTTCQSIALTRENPGKNIGSDIIEAYDYDMVDEPPTFPGGYGAMMQFINATRNYPPEAYTRRIQGRVLCSFIVEPDGAVTHINVIRGVEPTLDREAVRILDGMPHWHAGRNNGSTVPVYCIFPVTFRL
jgi:TonB family protein